MNTNPLEALNGYRTLIAGIGSAAWGIYLITQGQADTGAGYIVAGLAAIGIGGKLDRNTEAVKDVVAEVKTVATEVQTGAEEAAARDEPPALTTAKKKK
jgi:hypothetical protein